MSEDIQQEQDLDIEVQLTMGSGGSITNTNNDFSIGDDGYSVAGQTSFADSRAYTVKNGLTTIGGLWSSSSTNTLILDALAGNMLVRSTGLIDIDTEDDMTIRTQDTTFGLRILNAGATRATFAGTTTLRGKVDVEVNNAANFMEVTGNTDNLRLLQLRNPSTTSLDTSVLRMVVSTNDDFNNYAEIRAVRDNAFAPGAHGFSIRTSPGTGTPLTSFILEPDGNVIFPEHYTTSFSANAHLDATGNLTRSTSSSRYKKNIRDLSKTYTSILDITDRLRPVTFQDKQDDSKHIGLIAEEVYGIIPELVTLHEGEPDGVEYPHMVALLVQAVKELKEEIEMLKAN